jgi:toxin ParE1/3/4
MQIKPVVRRPAARLDVDETVAHYAEIDVMLAYRFVDELEAAIHHIQKYPGTGFPRYADILKMNGLRHWMLNRFPYTIFYFELENCIDVVRMLHQSADIPSQLRD